MFLITWKRGSDDISDVIDVRRRVFVDEQGFDPSGEPDDIDSYAVHAALYEDGLCVGTARIYPQSGSVLRIGRLAVLNGYRSKGYGDALMRALLLRACNSGIPQVRVLAQLDKESFYSRYGFERVGELVEDGAPHIDMRLMADKIDLSGRCCGDCARP